MSGTLKMIHWSRNARVNNTEESVIQAVVEFYLFIVL
jgi:hypothetical protein